MKKQILPELHKYEIKKVYIYLYQRYKCLDKFYMLDIWQISNGKLDA